MGFMDKVKKILFDEDVVEVPVSSDELPERTPKNVKKEEKHESTGFIEYHKSEEVEEDPIKEIKVPKEEVVVKEEEEKKFNFPEDIDFEREIPTRQKNYDDMDLSLFDDELDVKSEGIVNSYRVSKKPQEPVKKEITDYRKMLGNEKGETEKKPFQNTPVISPVWGILDKNYKPEEIVNRAERLTKVNTGAVPRSYGPVSYNDQPLPVKRYDTKDKEEKKSLKEDLVELNSTISDMISEDAEEEKKEIKEELPKDEIHDLEKKIENIVEEEIVPTHSIDDIHDEANDDEVIQTSNYDDYEELSTSYDDVKSIEDEENEHNNIEDAFESTSEFDSIRKNDTQDDEDEPEVDLETLVDKKDDDDDDDSGLDNTIETDLFNLIDSMYKDDEEE